MTEWSVTYIVTQGYGFNKIKIKIKKSSYISRNSGHQLHMKAASCDIIIAEK